MITIGRMPEFFQAADDLVVMTHFDHILDRLVPHGLPQVGLELTDRWRQPILVLAFALCTLGVQAQVDQVRISAG